MAPVLSLWLNVLCQSCGSTSSWTSAVAEDASQFALRTVSTKNCNGCGDQVRRDDTEFGCSSSSGSWISKTLQFVIGEATSEARVQMSFKASL